MKCAEYRDLHELLLDGALAGPAAEEARAHAAGCDGCRGFEAECATMLAPLAGFPPGPYLPPPPAGRLPPWAAGGTLGALLVLVVLGGAIALGLQPSGPRPATETGAARPRPRVPAAPMSGAPLPSAESPFVAPGEEGQTVVGRVMAAGGRDPLSGVRVLVDGVEAARSDAAGLFTVHGLTLSGWRRLRLEPPGGASIEAVLPCLPPYGHHVLEPIEAGAGLDAEVRVIGPDALPVPGARVRATRLAQTSYPDGQPDFRSGPGQERLPVNREVETDAAGLAAFAGLARGSWTFQAEKEGMPTSRPLRRRLEGPWIPTMSLYLDAPAVLEGRVLDDATGEPVEGALVRWTRGIDASWAHDLRFGGSTRSGPGGTFRFPAAPAVPVLVVEALRPGSPFVGGSMAMDSTAVGRVDLRVSGTTVVAGTCVEAGTGRPAAGVLLSIRAELREEQHPSTTVSYARSDGDGRVAIPGVPDCAGVTVTTLDHGRWFSPAPGRFELPRTPDVPWRIEVARTGGLRGIVRDEEGRPAPACVVRAMVKIPFWPGELPRTAPAAQSLSAADGTFLLHDLRPGPAAVFAFPGTAGCGLSAFGRAGQDALTAPEPPSFVVDVRPGGETPVAVVRRPAEPPEIDASADDATNTIRGQVLGPRGTPVDGARVHVSRGDLVGWMERPGSNLLRIPMGDPFPVAADGSFTAEVPSTGQDPGGEGEPYTLWAFAPGFPPAAVAARVHPGGSVEGVRIHLQEGAAIEGRVVREDGSAAAGILLESVEDPSGRVGGLRTAVQARTAEDGTFRIAGLRPIAHFLVAGRFPGPVHGVPHLLPGTGPVEMRLPPGDGVREPSLFRRLSARTSPDPAPAPASTASIRGRLVAAEGTEALLRQVRAVDPLRALAMEPAGSVEPGGRFEVKVAAGSRVTIAANHADGRWAFADDVPAGASDVVLRLGGAPSGLLRGRVVTPAGTAAGGIPVHAVLLRRPPEGPEQVRMQPMPLRTAPLLSDQVPGAVRTTLTEPDGSFDLGSPRGRWAVFAGAPGDAGPTPSRAVDWSAADSAPLELVLGGPGRTLAVRATGEDAATGFCAKAADARLDGFLPGPGPVLAIRLNPDSPGTFRFQCLPEGPVTVVLYDYERREVGRATAVPGEPGEPPVEVPLRR